MHGLVLVALGLSISLDELAIGFTIGLLHLSLWVAIVLIGAQAFIVAQPGLASRRRSGFLRMTRAGFPDAVAAFRR